MFTIEISENTNPLLKQVSIKNQNLNFQAIIYPNLGASLQQLSSNNIELIDGITPNEEGLANYKSSYNSSLLFPFPNRITDGKYKYNFEVFQLNCNEEPLNNALHGVVYNQNFEIVNIEVENDFAKVELHYLYKGKLNGFPFPFKLNVTYLFRKNSLTLNYTIENTGAKKFPYGIGWHPYFKTNNISTSVLKFYGKSQFQMNEQMIPIGETELGFESPLTIGKVDLDDCFTLQNSSCLFKTEEYNLELSFPSEENHQYLQVYIPQNRKSIAIEPMTCIGNTFNNKIGLKILNPNETSHWGVLLKFKTNT